MRRRRRRRRIFFPAPNFQFPIQFARFYPARNFLFCGQFFFSFSSKDCASALIFTLEKCVKKRSSLVSERRGKKVLFGLVQIFLKKPILQFPATNTWEFGSTISQCQRTEPGCGERTKKNTEKMPHFVSWLQFDFFKCKFDFPIPLLKGKNWTLRVFLGTQRVCESQKKCVFCVCQIWVCEQCPRFERETKIIMIK